MFKEALNPSIRKSPHPEVNPDAPPRVPPSRGVSTAMKPKLEDELKRLTDLRLIALVDKPTDWVSNLAIGTKKSRDPRICIDTK